MGHGCGSRRSLACASAVRRFRQACRTTTILRHGWQRIRLLPARTVRGTITAAFVKEKHFAKVFSLPMQTTPSHRHNQLLNPAIKTKARFYDVPPSLATRVNQRLPRNVARKGKAHRSAWHWGSGRGLARYASSTSRQPPAAPSPTRTRVISIMGLFGRGVSSGASVGVDILFQCNPVVRSACDRANPWSGS